MFILFGFLFGVIQFLLLKMTTDAILSNSKIFIVLIALKVVFYAGAVALMWFCFSDMFIHAGIGLGLGMLIGAFANFIYLNFIKPKGDDRS